MRLLLAEDDALLGAGLRSVLGKSGFDVTWITNGQAAFDLLMAETFSAMVLDINLPGMNGIELLQNIRAAGSTMPVLMLTARDSTRDKVISLQYGADDYLVKTTDMEELIARLRALIRRSGHGGTLSVGKLTLDADTRSMTQDGQPLNLSRREFDILRALMEGAGRVLTRGQLEASIYGLNHSVESNALEVHIHNLRLKIGAATLRTVRGIGYTIARQES